MDEAERTVAQAWGGEPDRMYCSASGAASAAYIHGAGRIQTACTLRGRRPSVAPRAAIADDDPDAAECV